MASITLKTNFKPLIRDIKDIEDIDMRNIGIKALELNEDQIGKKKNRDGSSFKSYTAAYAKRKGVGRGEVDLVSKGKVGGKLRGTMLKSFGILRITKRIVEIGFRISGNREKAKGNVNTRPFVGLQTGSRKKLFKFASNILLRRR